MKTLLTIIISVAIGFAAGYTALHHLLKQKDDAFAQQQSAWAAEKASLEAQLTNAKGRTITLPGESKTVEVSKTISPAEILARLQTMKPVASQPRTTRQLIHQFESLTDAGPAALPVIRGFLMRNQEIEYDANFSRRFRDGKVPTDFQVPPSIRLGLFEVVKNIGGDEAEQLLADVLKSTGRGVEVAYLAGALQGLAPNKYRDLALSAVHELLAKPLAADPSSPIDRFDRSFLIGVLMMFNDGSYAAEAQAQVIQPDGKIDAVAMNYLQQTLGQKSVALAAQAWQDPRVPENQKEPLARVALAYVGTDAQAEQLYQTAINDPKLTEDARRNLIEDLNETGFSNPRQLTDADLPMIQKRLALIDRLAPNAMDQINSLAFKEAYKDLVNMQKSLQPKISPTP